MDKNNTIKTLNDFFFALKSNFFFFLRKKKKFLHGKIINHFYGNSNIYYFINHSNSSLYYFDFYFENVPMHFLGHYFQGPNKILLYVKIKNKKKIFLNLQEIKKNFIYKILFSIY